MVRALAARERRRGDALAVLDVALAVRLAAVAWGASRFPAVEDGHYYDVLARRLAAGQGYTWSWPDGAVTYAAHYPVGYPVLLAVAYVLLGGGAWVAPMVNAALGAAAAWGAHAIVDGAGVPRWRPLAAGLVVALHPALVSYTPAVMTEGVTAAILVVAAGLAACAQRTRRRWTWAAAIGITMGVATLVRPQSLVLAPVVGALALPAASTARARLLLAAAVTAVAVAVVAPWTARNCVHMHRCAFVSVNGGWNLLIGAHSRAGAWEPVDVPAECATVWDEAQKDVCFERAARREIAAAPFAWLSRAPGKIAATLDYFGAAPWYLHASNPGAFDDARKACLGAVETVACDLFLLVALVRTGCAAGPRFWARMAVAFVGGLAAAISLHTWIGYLALAATVLLFGARALARGTVVAPATAAVLVATAGVHAAFFGAGRYGLVVVPFVAALAFARLSRPIPPVATASRASSASKPSPSLSAASRS
jgi:hypothetical protein